MSTARISDRTLEVKLTSGEKLAGLVRDVRVPLSAVRHVEVLPGGVAAARGLRSPGLAVPGVRKVGTWRRNGRREFVDVRGNGPALRVTLSGQHYDSLLLSVPGADGFAYTLRAAAGLQEATAGNAIRGAELFFTSGDLTLAGTLTLPAGSGPAPAVLLVTGSGPLNRDGDHRRLPIGVSKQLAESLATHGVASYRYDKRGVGTSGGSYLRAGLNDNIDDLAAALEMLAARPEVDPSRLYILGHSEGAILAAAVAGRGVPLAGVILLAGAAGTGEEVLHWQLTAISRSLPAPVRAILKILRVDLAKKQEKDFTRIRASRADSARMGGRRLNVKWMREFLDHDTARDLARIQAPVLAITGAKDLQVNPEDVARIERLVPGPVTGIVVPDVSHLLRAQTGEPSLSAYKKDVRKPVDARVTNAILEWMTDRTADRDSAPADASTR